MTTSGNDDLLVIGAGLGRTGTLSLRNALSILYGKPVYHMSEVRKQGHARLWIAAQHGSDDALREILKGYPGAVDFPVCAYFDRLMQMYPKAKIILTIRNTPEEWAKSARETILANHPMQISLPGLVYSYSSRDSLDFRRMLSGVLFGSFNDPRNEQELTDFYRKWNERVLATVPKERLLVFNVTEGWAPLCAFLNKPIPQGLPFPRVNDSKSFQHIYTVQNREGRRIIEEGLDVLRMVVADVAGMIKARL